jgi:anaerobic ribonucleoside-triphosphate reductase activating protein
MTTIRIAGKVPYSTQDGLGLRYVVFFQGCKHGCVGCHNPHTHSFSGGEETTTEEIIKDIQNTAGITGVTISGGDPFFQYEALLDLCRLIRRVTSLDIWVYTGFEEQEIRQLYPEILSCVDALVLGKFIQEEKTSSLPFIGSKNQKVIYV